MYKLKVLVALETDSSPSVLGSSSTTLAWYESIRSKELVEVLEVACDVDDFFIRNCLYRDEEVRENQHRGFFENLLALDSSKKK